jgi:hypothetical protein
MQYARIRYQISATNFSNEMLGQWIEALNCAANWSGAQAHDIFYIEHDRIIGVSIPFENEDKHLLHVGCELGLIKSEINLLTTLDFDNAWLSIEPQNNDVL